MSNPTSTTPTSNDKHNDTPLVLLFDLDGTLYDQNCGYVRRVHSNIFDFLVQQTGGKFDEITDRETAIRIWTPIFQKYNLTKRGLLGEGYVFDTNAYDTFIRQGAEDYLHPDPELRKFLTSIPCARKVIFTNAPETSAREILQILGVEDLFEAVLGTDFLEHRICKPEVAAFHKVLEYLQVPPEDYGRVWFFEDSYKNLQVGKQVLGFRTVFVQSSLTLEGEGKQALDFEQFDAIIAPKVDMKLKEQVPELWNK